MYDEKKADKLFFVFFSCKCSKSKCLKLYCDCFQVGRVCADRCSCKNCLNTPAESGKNGRRTAAIQNILDRRPDAFDVRVKKIGQGCSCKKNKYVRVFELHFILCKIAIFLDSVKLLSYLSIRSFILY
jgi:hypothetical protein